jgi:hypothetical protein
MGAVLVARVTRRRNNTDGASALKRDGRCGAGVVRFGTLAQKRGSSATGVPIAGGFVRSVILRRRNCDLVREFSLVVH